MNQEVPRGLPAMFPAVHHRLVRPFRLFTTHTTALLHFVYLYPPNIRSLPSVRNRQRVRCHVNYFVIPERLQLERKPRGGERQLHLPSPQIHRLDLECVVTLGHQVVGSGKNVCRVIEHDGLFGQLGLYLGSIQIKVQCFVLLCRVDNLRMVMVQDQLIGVRVHQFDDLLLLC